MLPLASVVPSLSDFCGRCVSKVYAVEDIVFILSNMDLSLKVVHAILSCMPINRVMDVEKLYENHSMFNNFWKKVVYQCKIKNCAFRKRLLYYKDPFLPPSFKTGEEQTNEKQVLINSLFQEALDKAYYITSKLTRSMPMFPLHVALDDNYPNIPLMEWLVQLTKQISCFHFYPKHARMLLNEPQIIEAMPKHLVQLDLMLNVTLNRENTTFKSFYTTLYTLLWIKCVKRVVFCNAFFTTQFKLTWELCAGKISSEYFLSTSKDSLKNLNELQNVDIWEAAIGGNDVLAESDEKEEEEDVDVYSGFVEDNGDDCGPKSSSVSQTLSDAQEVSEHVAVSEVVLEINDNGFPITSAKKLFQCELRYLKKLKIYLLGLGPMHKLSTEQKFVDEIVKLLCNPVTQLRVLVFSNFTFYSFCLHKIMKGIVTMYNNTGATFDFLSFVNCRWQENLSPLGFVYDNPCAAQPEKSFLGILHLQSLLFAHADGEISQPLSLWQQSFIQTLNPATVYVLGQPSFEFNEVHVPPALLQVDILKAVMCNRSSGLQHIVVYLPSPSSQLYRPWFEMLLETLTSLSQPLLKLLVISKHPLPVKLTKLITEKGIQFGSMQLDLDDTSHLPGNSVEDHVSEM